jgi:ribosomal protein L21E
MATTFREGDRVRIADRPATADDAKSGMFFDYYRGLTGTVQKVYPTQEAAVEIDMGSLTEPVAKRHLDVQEQMKTRWLDGLSEEARNRLSETEKDFRLRYTLLVMLKDLTAHDKPPVARPVPASAPVAEAAPKRATSADLTAAEEAELRRRRNG